MSCSATIFAYEATLTGPRGTTPSRRHPSGSRGSSRLTNSPRVDVKASRSGARSRPAASTSSTEANVGRASASMRPRRGRNTRCSAARRCRTTSPMDHSPGFGEAHTWSGVASSQRARRRRGVTARLGTTSDWSMGSLRSDHRVVVEVLARGLERDQVMPERPREHLGQPLGSPPLIVVHVADRAHVVEEHDLLAAHAEDLAGDLLGRLAREEDGHRRDVLGTHLLDLLHARLLRLRLGGGGAANKSTITG